MKYFIYLLACLPVSLLHAQPNSAKADEALSQLLDRLNEMNAVSYHYHRETRYFADNYHNISEADMYIEYHRPTPLGLRFRSSNGVKRSVYNGSALLYMNEKEKTIDTSFAGTLKSMQNNSDLYHSLAMLKNMIPLVIGSDSIRRSVSDTTVDGKTYRCVRMEGDQLYFGLFSGIDRFTATGLRRPYYLLIDPTTGLPYQFATRYIRNGNDRDFATVTYAEINTHPATPPEASWYYQSYLNVYKHLAPVVRKPLVKAGAEVADFKLPAYTPARMDSVTLKQYAGKVVLLDFWFKSCGPCMEAMPKYNLLQDRFRKRGFELVTVNIEDGIDDIKFFYNKHKPHYPMLFNGIKVFEQLGLRGCPSSVLINRDGKVARVFEGFSENEISEAIATLL